MASGKSNQGIAESLVISVGAAEKYVSSIFGKLGLPSTATESSACSPCCCSSAAENRDVETPENPTRNYRSPGFRPKDLDGILSR